MSVENPTHRPVLPRGLDPEQARLGAFFVRGGSAAASAPPAPTPTMAMTPGAYATLAGREIL